MASESLRDLREFAADLAWQAGKLTLRYFQTPFTTEYKEDQSPVTIADRGAERRSDRLDFAAQVKLVRRRGVEVTEGVREQRRVELAEFVEKVGGDHGLLGCATGAGGFMGP